MTGTKVRLPPAYPSDFNSIAMMPRMPKALLHKVHACNHTNLLEAIAAAPASIFAGEV